jgi:hypothetical protein
MNIKKRRTNVTYRTSKNRNSEITLSLEDKETVLLVSLTGLNKTRKEKNKKWMKRFLTTHVRSIEQDVLS